MNRKPSFCTIAYFNACLHRLQFFSFGFSCEIDNFANFLLLKNLNLSCRFRSVVTNCSLPADHSIMYILDEILQFHEIFTLIDVSHQQLIKQSVELKSEIHRPFDFSFRFEFLFFFLSHWNREFPIPTSKLQVMAAFFVLNYSSKFTFTMHGSLHVNFSMLNNVKPEFSHSQSLCCVNKRPHRFCVYHEPKNMFNISRQRKTETKNGSEEMVKSKTYNNENHLLKL